MRSMLAFICDGVTPAHVSLPHVPVANASVSTRMLLGMADETGCRVPVTTLDMMGGVDDHEALVPMSL